MRQLSLLGATLHPYPHGEDEAGADARLEEIAAGLRAEGRTPYVIHLAPVHPPLGALGYVVAARELAGQLPCAPARQLLYREPAHAAARIAPDIEDVLVERPLGSAQERLGAVWAARPPNRGARAQAVQAGHSGLPEA